MDREYGVFGPGLPDEFLDGIDSSNPMEYGIEETCQAMGGSRNA